MQQTTSFQEANNQPSISEMNSQVDKRIGAVFRTMLLFTTVMVLGPISSYFLSKTYIYEGYFQASQDYSYIYSAITAVVVIHIILGAFIWIAWKDANSEQAIAKKKD